MRAWRTIEAIVLLAVIAFGVRYWLGDQAEPGPHARPSVNGVTPGMSLTQAEEAVGKGFKTIQHDEFRWELQGEGSYPVSIFLDFFGRHEDESEPGRDDRYYTGRSWAVLGTEVTYQGHRLSAGSAESLSDWMQLYPDYRRGKDELFWELPEFEVFARVGPGEVPIDVGLTRKGHPGWGLDSPPSKELPVRPRGLLTRQNLVLNGIQLGMSEAEVREILGEPSDTHQDSLSACWRKGRIEVYTEQGLVDYIEGDSLEFKGERLTTHAGQFDQLFENLGRVDDAHIHSVVPVQCWSDPGVKIHVSGYLEREHSGVRRVYLIDTRGLERSAFCIPACGGI